MNSLGSGNQLLERGWPLFYSRVAPLNLSGLLLFHFCACNSLFTMNIQANRRPSENVAQGHQRSMIDSVVVSPDLQPYENTKGSDGGVGGQGDASHGYIISE